MKTIVKIILNIYILALVLLFTACGSSGGGKGSDYIPPYIDPNGGPVIKIDVGNSDTSFDKKLKLNSFQKANTESVKVYKLDGTLKGTAEKLLNGNWQVQVNDSSPTLIKAVINNGKGGKVTLESILPVTSTSTVYVNTDTTKIVYLAWLNAFFQSNEMDDVSDVTGLINSASNDLESLGDGNYLKILIEGLSVSDTSAVQVSTASIYVRKLLALFAVAEKMDSYISKLESKSLTTTVPSSTTGMFASGGMLDLTEITKSLVISEIKPFIDNVVSSLIRIKIIGDNIVVSSIASPSTTETITLALTATEILAMQALFSISNKAPAFTSTPITTATAGQLYSYTPTGSDADGDAFNIDGVTIPSWLTFNGTVLSGTPAATNVGAHIVVLSITDNKISSVVTQNFTITVSGTGTLNESPVITSTAITTATENSLYQYKIIATDADNDTLTYSVVEKPTWLNFATSTGLLSGTPSDSNIGDHDVILQVTDGKTAVQQTFTITVTPAPENSPPVFATIGTLNATEGVLFSKTIVATDPDEDTVTLAAKSLPTWLTFNQSTGVLSGTPSNSDFSLNKVTITATDGIITTPIELKLTININTIPHFNSSPVTSVIAGTVYNYNIDVSDTDGNSVILTAPTLPAFLTLNASASTLTGAASISDIGVYDVVLSASDNKAVTSGKQSFSVRVLNNLFIAKVNNVEVTNLETVKYLDKEASFSIKARDEDSDLTFSMILDGTELVLTNDATSVTLTGESQTLQFIATDSLSVQTTITVTLEEDSAHIVEIVITGGTKIDDEYRRIPGTITFSSKFQNNDTDPIISKTIQLDDVPQSLNSNNEFVLDPLTIAAGAHEIKATISYTDLNDETQTVSTTIDFILIENTKPTQVIKIDSLVINSDTAFVIHDGSSVTITTSEHSDEEADDLTKGLIIDGVYNNNLTSYTVTLNTGETKTVKSFLADPYEEATAYTISLSASSTNGGVPISLTATGTKLANSTSYRDKINGEPNFAKITVSIGVDSENDGVSLIEWLVNSVVVPNENTETLELDLSTYGGTTVLVVARVTDAYLPSPTVTTATTTLVVDLDSPPTITSAKLNNVAIALTAAISVDHSVTVNKIYVPIASDPEGDDFSIQYLLNSINASGSQFSVPYDTLTGSVLTVNLIQFGTIAATNTHNITANNIVPTPIIIGNSTHVDLNGNYSLIVKPGIDLEGDKLTTTVTLNSAPISGVVVNNEIHFSVDLSTLGGTTAVFVVTNDDVSSATPISTTFNVTVVQSLAPTGLTATRGSKSVTLSWNSVNTATSYNLYYGTSQSITTGSTKIATITSPYTLSGLTDGTTYYFRVSANHVGGEGPLSGTDIPMTPHSAGDTLIVTINAVPYTFKFIPAGSFTMGALSTETGFVLGEDPQHVVTISKEFWMLQNEVTQNQWSSIITPSHPSISSTPSTNVGANLPVENVSWEDVMGTNGFIDYLHLADVNNILTSGLYKLPTEAQWEYAFRAGTSTRFHWGDDSSLTSISTYAWYSGNATTTNIVTTKTANDWGLYDMSGNVSEWCLDKAPSAYTSSAATDPSGAASGNERIYRGGSWFDSGNNCRSAKRYSASKDIVGSNLGFRFIRVPLATE